MTLLAVGLAFLASVLPAAFYVAFICWLDRYEREPWWLITLAFFWGAIPSIVLALVLEIIFSMSAGMFLSPEASNLANIWLGAPFIEESLKAISLLSIFFIFRKHFDGVMDGLLYGAVCGLGFAMTENFSYFWGAYREAGMEGLAITIVLRQLVFGTMHGLWSSMLGWALGLARYSNNLAVKLLVPPAAFGAGILLHCTHNFFATQGLPGLAVDVLLYGMALVFWFGMAIGAGWQEAKWIREELAEEVNGCVLTPEQAVASGRYRSRVASRWKALTEKGYGHWHRLGHLYYQASALAFKKRQLRLHPGDQACAAQIQSLRQEVAQLSPEFRA
jgi:RsiW-degrading membrane proteinase PrsW (M82 family)